MAAHAHPGHAHPGHTHHDGERGPAHDHGPSRGPALTVAFFCTLAIAALEFGGGLVAHSLALLSDSAHVLMDAVALGIAVFASVQARRPANAHRTFGYARVEVLAALGNGGLLFAIAVLIVVEAVRRLGSSVVPEGGVMLAVAAIGLATNVVLGLWLMRAARENLNVKAALYHIGSDVVGALAVAIAGALVVAFRAPWIDPLVSLAVAVLIAVGVLRVVREAADVLLESAPAHAATGVVRNALLELPGVGDVHDLHVWTIGSGTHVLTAHVLLPDARISEATSVLHSVEALARARFAITHVTLQFECEPCADHDRIVCTQSEGPR